MAGHEIEGRCRGLRCRAAEDDTRVLVVRRRLIERTNQRRAAGGAHRGAIEPVDAAEGAADVGDRPFPSRRVGNRHRRDVAGRVVPRDDAITRAVPTVVARTISGRDASLERAPPAGVAHLERIELHGVFAPAVIRAGHAEGHRRLAVDGGQRKVALIELQPPDGARSTYSDYVRLEWARRWPAENIWKTRKRLPASDAPRSR